MRMVNSGDGAVVGTSGASELDKSCHAKTPNPLDMCPDYSLTCLLTQRVRPALTITVGAGRPARPVDSEAVVPGTRTPLDKESRRNEQTYRGPFRDRQLG